MKSIVYYLLLLLTTVSYGQKKILKTNSITANIIIDGKTDEQAWQETDVAKDFVMFEPDNGKPIPYEKRTEIKIIYDNDALYIAAIMYDNEPTKILKEITQRDSFGTSDLFGVFINGFNDGQQDFQFFVPASDSQADCITTDANGEDYSWDAVWDSKALITDFGWVVEMKIPYAALRFSADSKQTWGLNFFREIKRDREKYTWNLIDTKIGSFTQQAGILQGIENIKPPTRLFLMPYTSFYLNAAEGQKTYGTLKGGLDIKYGINDAFTLDAILVPDFGQTKFDDQILNLGPFEQQFNENRSFFTEGTDLFSKGNLFYSRRIGGSPSTTIELAENEEFIENPSAVNLINALKISGRTKGGLGIGILNAITEKTHAVITNTVTNVTRREVVEPLTNYNVLVLDQRFRKTSSIAFINTNVTRDGAFRDANVSALTWDLNTKTNTFGITGSMKYSLINQLEDKKGSYADINFAKTSGKYRFNLGADLVTKDFDSNDLGINFYTNFYSFFSNVNYRILNPTKSFNKLRLNWNGYLEYNKETGALQDNNFNVNTSITTKKNNLFGFGIGVNPLEVFDYYEPRVADRFVVIPRKIENWIDFSTNYNKKFAVDINTRVTFLDEPGRAIYDVAVGPRYRFSDKFLLVYNFNFIKNTNDKGYADRIDADFNTTSPKTIIFANRNVITYSNSISGKYALNSRMTFNLLVRQYWSYAENKHYLSLSNDGTLTDFATYSTNKNSNFNSWNADLSYAWWFAPGSQLSLLYRNSGAGFEREINKHLGENVSALINNSKLNHVFSISIKYFIDYNVVKNKF
ncbi:DUF5916 domain-containing protein [Flavobacterium sp. TAB 87]|uniref:DUF5916 domain-containing protein n=1 Tax=Flavobacterium sp. TAB 87 TaxID=1729581 RepID=UPI00076C0F93|nr:DUF5916 domain-containing protein [Flavobacterium sp. TAB 87]KVV14419.1 hypothetical protein AP058_02314 [Flavobacterium sp. TAB 87]